LAFVKWHCHVVCPKFRPKDLASAGEASRALYQAVRNNDDQAISEILGGNNELASSGDDAPDKSERAQFARKYEEMHRLVRQADGTAFLYVGAENWPFPAPLTAKDGKWYFDAESGAQEILFRTIGENEARARAICRSIVPKADAGVASGPEDVTQYVQAVRGHGADARIGPMQGYFFRVLNKNDGSVKKVAYIAYPADYRCSGVMTFVVTADGVVYESDLGPETSRLASSLDTWGPTKTWRLVKE
jgi:hypothetical protein